MSRPPQIVVIGSANMDLVVRTEHIPAPGETVLGGAFVTAPGGKGANQAVSAARLGAQTLFVGRVGQDAFGDALRDALNAANIDTRFLAQDSAHPTGVALIGVDAQGQNAIIVAPGANAQVSSEDIEQARDRIAQADMLIIQLEIPLATVQYAIALAKEVGVRVLLNPAPVRAPGAVPDELLRQVDILTPNAHEALSLLDYPPGTEANWEQAARNLRERCSGIAVITLGEEGAVLADAQTVQRIEATPVTPIDTTAAGDCFSGALAVALSEGQEPLAACRFAARAAALSVTRLGAQPSLPTLAEVNDFCADD